jgi:DNA polymerase III gamma/tau subunit
MMTTDLAKRTDSKTPAYLYQGMVEFDAQTQGYELNDIESLLQRISSTALGESTLLVLKNAHYLTTTAFVALYEYLKQNPARVMVVLLSSDNTRIFPPLFEYVVTA